ncbi:MAG: hypothetical protein RIS54_691 [Verrucomicrobiota bacterium]|jgi:hypothetical protein
MPENERPRFISDRPDGRMTSTAGFYHQYLKHLRPRLAFDPAMSAGEMAPWRERVRAKLLDLMAFPEGPEPPPPACVRTEARDGYRLEKWEAYPEPWCVVPFYLLVPDGVSATSSAATLALFLGISREQVEPRGRTRGGGDGTSHRPQVVRQPHGVALRARRFRRGSLRQSGHARNGERAAES